MPKDPRKLIAYLCLLAVVWIAVYWWWEPRSDPRLVFAPPMVTVESQARTDSSPDDVEPQPEYADTPEALSTHTPLEHTLPVEPPSFIEYTVKRNDTLESIARAHLGHHRYVEAIRRANPMSDLTVLPEGRVIKIPIDPDNIQGRPIAQPQDESAAPSTERAREYVVQSGDSLSRISHRMYGSSQYVDLIYEANRQRLGLRSRDAIREGQVLIIPPKPTN